MRLGLLVVAVFAACQQELPPPPPVTPVPVHAAGPPFVVRNLVVAEDGAIVRGIAELDPYDIARPVGPHRFAARGVIVDTATATVTTMRPPVLLGTDSIGRVQSDGHMRWTQKIEGAHSVRPPDVAIGGERVLAAVGGAVHAFDDVTGEPLWTVPIAGERLTIAGDTAYSTTCGGGEHWLIGTAIADGKQRFRAELPRACDPYLEIVNGLVIVTDPHLAQTRIFDLAGRALAELAEVVEGAGAVPFGRGFALDTITVLVTDLRVIAMNHDGRVVWQHDYPHERTAASDDLVELPGGDFVLASFDTVSDSGVSLVRLRRDGSEVWQSCAAPLGVGHSEYEHFAYLEVRG
ncbi:MAG TPA: PQQ-binding-like beta-propeller repeat protein, partial [Kofleriaceae bacterium]|nr:PQQ-binding-like beta-propeller repeat protein [Kofleriaceae bacterium]